MLSISLGERKQHEGQVTQVPSRVWVLLNATFELDSSLNLGQESYKTGSNVMALFTMSHKFSAY